jgi:6-phosphogluconate dehydrogenase
MTSQIGLIGLAVMGQNLALNVAEKGFSISVFNRTYAKTEAAVARAKKSGLGEKLHGYEDIKEFVQSLEKPRRVIMLVMAGKPVDATIDLLTEYLEEGDVIIDGGNEWYENTERRAAAVAEKGIRYMGMGVSGGEEGARNGPSMMPGGDADAYKFIEPIVTKVAAQVDDGPCVMHIGPGGSGNFVKMVHNGIEYGDMQLISEAYDVLRTVGGLTNDELAETFTLWNKGDLDSFLIEISSLILPKKDDKGDGFLVDKILDKTGMKGTGKWTVQQAAELSVAAPTIEAALDGRFLSGLKDQRVAAAKYYESLGLAPPKKLEGVDKQQLIEDVAKSLYAAKVCSYAQGMNIIKAKSAAKDWNINLGALARIWKGGCIIRANFLDEIKQAYERDPALENLLMDEYFAKKLTDHQESWRRVVKQAIDAGIATPGISTSLSYFDQYRRENLPANLVQAQRDFFGSHTYERNDGQAGWFHTVWSAGQSADSITTSGYKA